MSSHRRSKNWSPWEWSQENNFYFRYTTDQYGQPDQWDYDYTGERAAAIPRSAAGLEAGSGAELSDLTAGLSIQDTQSSQYTTDPYAYGGGYAVTSSKKGRDKDKHGPKKKSKKSDRDQSGGYDESALDPFYQPPVPTADTASLPSNAFSAEQVPPGDGAQPLDPENEAPLGDPGYDPPPINPGYLPQGQGSGQADIYDGYEAAQVNNSTYAGDAFHSKHHKSGKGKGKAQWTQQASQQYATPDPQNLYPDDENDADLREAMNMSRREAYGTSSTHIGGSSTSDLPEPSSYYDPYTTNDPAASYVPEEAPGETTPKAGSLHGSGSLPVDEGNPGATGYSDTLDERYMVQSSHKFQPGEVFKVLWSEPVGQGGAVETTYTDPSVRENYGQRFYVGFRRFIVIANDQGHCTCVPILTYEHRGCRKKGVKPQKHGIVYQLGGRARMLEGEPHLGFEPIRLELDLREEKIAKESRVNYSKLVTIEHNVRVLFIGRVYSEDFYIVQNAVDHCWNDKIHKQQHHGKKHKYVRYA